MKAQQEAEGRVSPRETVVSQGLGHFKNYSFVCYARHSGELMPSLPCRSENPVNVHTTHNKLAPLRAFRSLVTRSPP